MWEESRCQRQGPLPGSADRSALPGSLGRALPSVCQRYGGGDTLVTLDLNRPRQELGQRRYWEDGRRRETAMPDVGKQGFSLPSLDQALEFRIEPASPWPQVNPVMTEGQEPWAGSQAG